MCYSEITSFDQKMRDRFESLVVKDQENGCWLSPYPVKYGNEYCFTYKKAGYNAAYASYCLYKEIVPKGTILKRTCGNLKCINPEHLETSTKRDIERQRFEKSFTKSDPDKCWEWESKLTNGGYGQFKFYDKKNKQKTTGAHRISFIFYKGEIPEGMFVCHSCDNPRCVNPKHLWLGTAADNNADKVSKNRQARHIHKNGNILGRKVNDQQVKEIREKYKTGKYSQRDLGKEYSVVHATICQIVNHKTRKDL